MDGDWTQIAGIKLNLEEEAREIATSAPVKSNNTEILAHPN